MTRWVWLACPVLVGCFLSSRAGDDEGPGLDGSVSSDGSITDGPRDVEPICPSLGIYHGCDELCEGSDDCPGGGLCNLDVNICIPPERQMRSPQPICVHDFESEAGGTSESCTLAVDVCFHELRVDSGLDDRVGYHATGCVHSSFCTSPTELHPDHGCYYSDLTPVVTGPASDECPSNESSRWPFCGLECGDCEDLPGHGGYVGCVGINDERGVGVCVGRDRCAPGAFILDPDRWEALGEPEPVACLVLRDPLTDEYWEWGWPTGAATCRAYRELYPDRFDCRDFDWNSIE